MDDFDATLYWVSFYIGFHFALHVTRLGVCLPPSGEAQGLCSHFDTKASIGMCPREPCSFHFPGHFKQ